ncbi:MAG: iron-sulfur cluster assembly scaffold protein [Candidatus Acidiferrum sp.]
MMPLTGNSNALGTLPRAAPAAIILSMFSQTLLDHFQHPRNAGELPGANVQVEVSNPVCGDVLHLAAIIENDSIREVRFLCRGCTAAIACASFLTESMQGRELSALSSFTPEFVAASLDGLPPASFHAANLAHDALQAFLRVAQK